MALVELVLKSDKSGELGAPTYKAAYSARWRADGWIITAASEK